MKMKRVVVLGGSMAGLLAAAAAAPHAEEVVVVERDQLDGAPVTRKGVPQAKHSHNLYPSGRAIIETLVPGFTDELRRRGAVVTDSGESGRWIIGGVRLARVRTGRVAIFATRALMDAALLSWVRALSNVRIADRTDISGLLFERGTVVGVQTVPRDERGDAQRLDASLVIDATGRGSRVTAWLEAAGWASPPLDTLEVKVAYATRTFERKDTDLNGDRYVFLSGQAPHLARGSAAFAVEGQRWMVLLYGTGGEKPPTDLAGFRRYAASLAAPDVSALVANAAPLDDGVPFAFPRVQRRRFDRVRMPENLLVIGDALLSTSPSWGAGMTAAALQAQALASCFATGQLALFHQRAIAATQDLWQSTTQGDLAFDSVPGSPALPFRVIARYVQALGRAASEDPVLAQAFLGLIDRVNSPSSILTPRIAWRVLWGRRSTIEAPILQP